MDDDLGLQIKSSANNKFTWRFHKPKHWYYYSPCKTARYLNQFFHTIIEILTALENIVFCVTTSSNCRYLYT